MGILLFELFRNPLFMGILNKWETLVNKFFNNYSSPNTKDFEIGQDFDCKDSCIT